MRILMIFHAAPYPPELGPARRHYHLLRELLKRHEISILSFGTPEQHRAFLLHFGNACRHVRFVDNRLPQPAGALIRLLFTLGGRSALRIGYTRELQRSLDRLAAETEFDLIICSIPFLARYRLPANVPVISDTHNVEWLVLQRSCRETPSLWRKIYYFLQTRHTRREELAAASSVEAVLTTSTCEREIFRSSLPSQRFFVVPNGLDVRAYRTSQVISEPHHLLFTGLMSYYPNAHGIEWFLDEIFPRIRAVVPDARLTVAGARPSRSLRARASEHVTVTGYVSDIRPYFDRAEVFVVPLRIGGGTRVKILEAMAMRRPIVTTTLGCEGLDVVHGDSLLIADTAQEFADAVIRLLRDRYARDALRTRAHTLVKERYDWACIGMELDRVIHTLAQRGQRSITASHSTH